MNDDTYISQEDIDSYCTNCRDHTSKRTRSTGKVLDYCNKFDDYCFKVLRCCQVSKEQNRRLDRMVQQFCMDCEFITNRYNPQVTKGTWFCLHYGEYARIVIEKCNHENKHILQTTFCGNVHKVI